MTCAALGSPRVLVSGCKPISRSAVRAEVASSSLVVPAIFLSPIYNADGQVHVSRIISLLLSAGQSAPTQGR